MDEEQTTDQQPEEVQPAEPTTDAGSMGDATPVSEPTAAEPVTDGFTSPVSEDGAEGGEETEGEEGDDTAPV